MNSPLNFQLYNPILKRCDFKEFLIISLILFISNQSFSQTINGYAKVTSVSGTTLTLSNVNETGDSFEIGDSIIVMQMQDDVIGTNTGDNTSFGDLNNIGSAGLSEIVAIATVTESAGVPTSITLSNTLTNSYQTGVNSSLQIITFPTFGSPNYTTIADIEALDWDGNVGGVLAMKVLGILTLNHSISADQKGFRKGSVSNNYYPGGGCNSTTYRVNSTNYGAKGEGIYKVTNSNYDYGRGKILNGGGGANDLVNPGGGGGGNFTAGGEGGKGNGCSPGAGGLGGIDLSTYINNGRVFLGGGGGGGQQNNSTGSSGGDGGGIIIIHADEIVTSCANPVSISANGETTSDVVDDGGGGGGAGGSIVLQVNTWTVSGSCPLTIEANGGSGGSNTTPGLHGAGAGGGQGAILFSCRLPVSPTNITYQTLNGIGGCDISTVPCPSKAGDGNGSDDAGIVIISAGNIPEIIKCDLILHAEFADAGVKQIDQNRVEGWFISSSEIGSEYFIISHSSDLKSWIPFDTLPAIGSENIPTRYSFIDEKAYEVGADILYYQIKEFDGYAISTYPKRLQVSFRQEEINALFYPNPTHSILNIDFSGAIQKDFAYSIQIFNHLGKRIQTYSSKRGKRLNKIDISHLPRGSYHVLIRFQGQHGPISQTIIKY